MHGGLADCKPVLWRRWREEEGKKRKKTRQRRKEEGETFKRRMHYVVWLICGVSAEYTCAVLLPAVWVTEYCEIFFLGRQIWPVYFQKPEIWWSACVWLTKRWQASCLSIRLSFWLIVLQFLSAVRVKCLAWPSTEISFICSPGYFMFNMTSCLRKKLIVSNLCSLVLSYRGVGSHLFKEEYFSILLLSSLRFHVLYAHVPLPPTQQQFPDQF